MTRSSILVCSFVAVLATASVTMSGSDEQPISGSGMLRKLKVGQTVTLKEVSGGFQLHIWTKDELERLEENEKKGYYRSAEGQDVVGFRGNAKITSLSDDHIVLVHGRSYERAIATTAIVEVRRYIEGTEQ